MDEIFPQHQLVMSKIFEDVEASDVHETISTVKRIGHKAETH